MLSRSFLQTLPQIDPQPKSWQYPLMKYLDLATVEPNSAEETSANATTTTTKNDNDNPSNSLLQPRLIYAFRLLKSSSWVRYLIVTKDLY